MASRREQVLEAVKVMVALALPFARVARNIDKPQRPEPGGLVIIRDGDIELAAVDLSPLMYNWSHRIPLEVMVWEGADLATALDLLMQPIGSGVVADRTLGGLVDFLQVEPPETDDIAASGVEEGRWADLNLVADYATPDPLN